MKKTFLVLSLLTSTLTFASETSWQCRFFTAFESNGVKATTSSLRMVEVSSDDDLRSFALPSGFRIQFKFQSNHGLVNISAHDKITGKLYGVTKHEAYDDESAKLYWDQESISDANGSERSQVDCMMVANNTEKINDGFRDWRKDVVPAPQFEVPANPGAMNN